MRDRGKAGARSLIPYLDAATEASVQPGHHLVVGPVRQRREPRRLVGPGTLALPRQRAECDGLGGANETRVYVLGPRGGTDGELDLGHTRCQRGRRVGLQFPTSHGNGPRHASAPDRRSGAVEDAHGQGLRQRVLQQRTLLIARHDGNAARFRRQTRRQRCSHQKGGPQLANWAHGRLQIAQDMCHYGTKVAPFVAMAPVQTTILCVANFPANTGYAWDFIEGLFAGLATRLAPAGVRTFVAYPEIASPPRTLRGTPARSILLDARLESLDSLRETVAFVRRERVSLLYLIDRPARSVNYAVLRAAGVRSILVHDHTSGAGTVPRGVKRLAKWMLARLPGLTADRVIAVSDFVARRQVDVAMIPARRVARVWNSVPLPPLVGTDVSRAARRTLGLDGDAPIIACTCRATAEKGVDHLLRAFDRLPGTPLLAFAGNGPAFAGLQALRDSLRSRDRIHLLGYRPDRGVLLDAADVCVVPSVWQEAFGLAALEAMVRGKPVVATQVGGIPEIKIGRAS